MKNPSHDYIPWDGSEETRTVLVRGAAASPRNSWRLPFVGRVGSGRRYRTRLTDGNEEDRIPNEARW